VTVLTILQDNTLRNGEREHHLSPHPGLPPGQQEHYHVLQGRGYGHRAGDPHGPIALRRQNGYDEGDRLIVTGTAEKASCSTLDDKNQRSIDT
jgi:hypothetical protein